MAAADAQFIAYYRVSTERQGESGLGLAAQREAVSRFLGSGRGSTSLLAEFTEVESGKRHTNRPELLKAIDLSRRQKATLVIAKLDRLARNVHFISGLMETGVEFVAADMPQANRLTIHILAAFAEHEREAISQRTKERSRLPASAAPGSPTNQAFGTSIQSKPTNISMRRSGKSTAWMFQILSWQDFGPSSNESKKAVINPTFLNELWKRRRPSAALDAAPRRPLPHSSGDGLRLCSNIST